jgi:hypothetical protein
VKKESCWKILKLKNRLSSATVVKLLPIFIIFAVSRIQLAPRKGSVMLPFSKGTRSCYLSPKCEQVSSVKYVLQEADCQLWSEHPPGLLGGPQRDCTGQRHRVAPLQQEQGGHRYCPMLLRILVEIFMLL